MDSSKKLVHKFMKNAMEEVRIECSKFMNKDVINIRVYYNAGIGKEDWRPSPKGITMHFDLIPELKKGIDKAYKEWQKQTGK